MARPTEYTQYTQQIIDMRNTGVSITGISSELGMSTGSVRRILLSSGKPTNDLRIYGVRQTDYSHVDPLWWAEFRGFFYGEGSIALRLVSSYGYRKAVQPAAVVQLRDDDEALVRSIHELLGGHILRCKSRGPTHASFRWTLTQWGNIYGLLPYLLESKLPSKKLREISLMKEACEFRFTLPHQDIDPKDRDILYSYYERMRMLKTYNSSSS